MCDDPLMWHLGTPPLEIAARTIIVYVVFLAALRIFGKREVGQFTLFDLALVLLAANALLETCRQQQLAKMSLRRVHGLGTVARLS